MRKIKIAPLFYLVENTNQDSLIEHVVESFLGELQRLVEKDGIRIALHLSGVVMEMARRKSPRSIAWIREMLKAGNLEFLGGAWSDAMLPLYPKSLQNLQLKRQRSLIRNMLQWNPGGWFCPSQAFEIGLVEDLCAHNYEYTVLPDKAFAEALSLPLPIAGWRTVEDNGHVIKVFPSCSCLSQNWFMDKIPALIQTIQELPENDRTWLVLIPVDPSKPKEEWMNGIEVARTLQNAAGPEGFDVQWWLPARAIDQIPPKGPICLISTLGEGNGLPASVQTCRELVNRRPEANTIHKRILHLHRRAHRVLQPAEALAIDSLLLQIQSARFFRNLPRNEGVLGLENRMEANRLLIETEKALDKMSDRGMRLEILDFLGNGRRQILMSSRHIGLLLENQRGGTLRTLDFKKRSFDWLQASLDDGLPASGFRDMLLPLRQWSIQDILAMVEDRQGSLTGSYDYQVKRQPDRIQVLMIAEQTAKVDSKRHLLRVHKVVGIKKNAADVQLSWQITNGSFHPCRTMFATEILMAIGQENRRRQSLHINGHRLSWTKIPAWIEDVKKFVYEDRVTDCSVMLEMPKPARLLIAPLLGSGGGAAPMDFQGYRLMLGWDLNLTGNASTAFHVRVRFEKRGWFQ